MPAVVFYFQVHQPFRLRHYTFFDIGEKHCVDSAVYVNTGYDIINSRYRNTE